MNRKYLLSPIRLIRKRKETADKNKHGDLQELKGLNKIYVAGAFSEQIEIETENRDEVRQHQKHVIEVEKILRQND